MAPRDALLYAECLTGSSDNPLRIALLDLREDVPKEQRMRSYERVGTVRDLHPWIAEHNERGYCVFAFVNEMRHPDGREFAINEDAKAVRAVFIDGDGGKGFEIPERWHQPPSFLCTRYEETHAGRQLLGCHAYWIVEGLSLDEYSQVQKRLALHYRTDDISDPRRIMRLPGYLHQKSGHPLDGYRLEAPDAG